MTVVVESPTVPAADLAPPITGVDRWRAAVLLTVGAALQVVEFVLEPPAKETGARLDWWAAHPDRLEWSQAAGILAIPFLIGAFLTMARIARPHSRRLTAVATVALTGAMAGLAAIHGLEFAASSLLNGGDRAGARTILELSDPSAAGAVLMVLFLGGALVGTVTMDIALWRSPYVPRLAVLLALAFIVLDFVLGYGRVSHLAALGSGAVLAWAVLIGYVRKPRRPSSGGAH